MSSAPESRYGWEETKAYFDRRPELKCPCCSEQDWLYGGLEFANSLHGENQRSIGGQVVPRVVLVCSHCGFICEFSWAFIEAAVKNDKA